MKKNPSRFLIAVVAFYVGLALPSWDKVKSAFSSAHYSKDSPYSVLQGRTVRIKPYDATFEIPEDWVVRSRMQNPEKNLYLSRKDLNELFWNSGYDGEDARVINSVLSFADCAAHVGDRDWGNAYWNDLQARVYIVDLTPEEVEMRIQTRGLDEALSVFEAASAIKKPNHGEWQKMKLEILDAPTHFMLMKDLDFYYRRFGSKTVVVIFLYASEFKSTITGILDSFEWSHTTYR